ncbi:MAG: carbohydrate kinase family protein [bacterium]
MSTPSLSPLRRKRAVILPDLYVDALAFLPPWATASRRLGAIAGRGGGNLPVPPIEFKLGGNAANLAVALAHLGAQVDLVAQTDELGNSLLQRAAAGTRLRTDGVRVGSKGSASLALEFGRSNVMLSHAGPLQEFGPGQLTKQDWQRIESADLVAVVNWAQNQRGTALLRALSARLDACGIFLYVDPGDVRHRGPDVAALRRDKSAWKGVGSMGMNDNELDAFTGGSTLQDAQGLAEELGIRIDLHNRKWAASVTGQTAVKVPAGRAPARRLTGAGDAWNAGNVAGYLLDLGDRERLALAHRVATSYVTGPAAVATTAMEVAR